MVRRNKHEWGWQGFDREGNDYEFCELCRTWKRNGVKINRCLMPLVTYQSATSKEEVWREWPL